MNEKNLENKNACYVLTKKMILIMLALFLVVMPALGEPVPTVFVPNATVSSPGFIKLPILISNVSNSQGLIFNMTYDPTVVRIRNAYPNNSFFKNSSLMMDNDNNSGRAFISLSNPNLTTTYPNKLIDIEYDIIGNPGVFTRLTIIDPLFRINSLFSVPASKVDGFIIISSEGGNGSYPDGNGSYPGGNGSYPGDNGSYPGGNGSYPGGNGSYPGGNGSYPDGNGSYPGGNGSTYVPPGGSSGGGSTGGFTNYDTVVTGRITSNGTPIPYAAVGVNLNLKGIVNWDHANETGYYSLGTYSGEGMVFVSSPGYVRKRTNITFGTVNVVDMDIRPANETHGSVSGYVLIYNTSLKMHTGARNVLVQAYTNEINGQRAGFDVTDSNGSYNITGLGIVSSGNPTNYTLGTFARGYSRSQTVLLIERGQSKQYNFTLSSGGTVSGFVRNSSGGPIADAQVDIFQPMSKSGTSTTTDSTGYYTMNVAQGVYEMMVSGPSGSSLASVNRRDIFINDGMTTYIDFSLSQGVQVDGYVFNEAGSPVQNADVNIFQPTWGGFGTGTQTNEMGYYYLSVPEGTYDMEVRPSSESGLTTVQERNLNIIMGQNYTRNFTLGRSGSISGIVLFGSTGLSNVNVNAWSMNGGFGWTQTNDTGYYSLTGLSNGSYEVRVDPAPGSSYTSMQLRGIEVVTGQNTPGVDFVLSTGSSLSGRVLSKNGSGVEFASINVMGKSGGWGWAQTNSTGHYTVSGLSNGSYDIWVYPPHDSPYSNAEKKDISVYGDVTGIDFTLSAAGSISGRVTNNDGTGIANVNINTWSIQGGYGWAQTDSNGNFTMRGLTDGTYTVDAQAPWGSVYASSKQSGIIVIAGNVTVVNFVLSGGGGITGRVTDSSGTGIANANMNAWSMGGMGGWAWAQTNSTGYYTLSGLQDGTYEVEAQAPWGSDYASNRTRGITVVADSEATVNFILTSGGRITGRVTNSSGAGIANSNINAWPIGGMGAGGWTQTNSTGHFTLTGLADGTYEVEAQAPWGSNYASNRARGISVKSGVTTTANFLLVSGGRVIGRVTSIDGTGLSNSNINAWSKEGGFGFAQTDTNGNFTINGLADGNYEVEAQAPWGSDYASNRSRSVPVIAGSDTTVNFILTSGGRIIGLITDINGAGLAYANINAWETQSTGGGFGWAQTNSTGHFTINGLKDGIYDLQAQPPWGSDYSSNRTNGIPVSAGTTRTVNLILGSGSIISGRVTDSSGQAISNSNINAWSIEGKGGWGWAMTDSNGNYSLRGLTEGIYEIEAQAPWGTEYASNRSKGVSLTTGASVTVNFVLGSGGKIAGYVTDSSGTGLSNANINAWSMEGGSGWAQTNSSGYYSINGLKNGKYEVEVQAPWGSEYTPNRTKGISVTSGNTSRYNFVLGSGGIISGRVTDSAGSGISYVNLNAWEMGGMGGGWGWTTSNSSGYYTMKGLKNGNYELEAQAPWGTEYASNRTRDVAVNANNITTVNFVMGSGGIISGRVTDSNGAGIANSNVNAWSMGGFGGGGGWATTNSSGYYTMKGLKDGTYEVEAQAPWGTEYASNRTQGVVVTAGSSTSLNFVLSSGGIISGRVTDSSGAGIANSNINAFSIGKVGGWSWATTNSTGHYSLKGLKASTYEVEAQAPWGTLYASNRTRNVIVTDGATTPNINIVLTSGSQITGRVTADGAGVSNAFINAWSMQGGSGRAQTDSSGYYTLSGLMDGDYDVRVEPPFGSELTSNSTKILISGVDQTADFVLSSGYSISGRVIDSNGNGISFTNVNIMTKDVGGSWAWAQTNSSGYYTLRGLNDGTYDVEAQAPWGSTLASSKTRVTINGANLVIDDIELSSGHSISGRVTSSGSGVSYANVNAWSKDGSSGWAQTNSTGYYTINSLSDAVYDIRVEPQYGSGLTSNSTRATISDSDMSGIDFELSSGHSISGQITSGGAGVAYAFVNAWSETGGWGWTQANTTGHYTLTGLGDATYEIRGEPQFGSGLAANSTSATLAGSDLTGIDIILAGGHSISGQVTSSGTGISNAIVNAWSQSGGWGWAETNINGNYTIEGLPDASYNIKVDPPYGSSLGSNSTNVTLNGSDVTMNIILSGGYELSGRVTNTSGTAIVKARVDAWNRSQGLKGWTETDSNGNYVIKGLMSAVYEVYAQAPSGSGYSDNRTTVNISGGSVSGVNLTLKNRVTITGRALNGSLYALRNANVDIWNSTTALGKSTTTDSNGNFTIRIAPGTYVLKVSYSGLTSNQTSNIVVTAGSELPLGDIILSSGKSISGRVLVAPSTAASGASVVAWSATGGSGYGVTNSSGYFTISGMPDGIYNLTAIYSGITNDTAMATVSASDVNAGSIIIPRDDGNPNYLSGTLTIGSSPAPAGTQYRVTVTSGDNNGYSYVGEVDDENVPSFEYGAGKYYTPDQTGFSSGASYELTIIGRTGTTSGSFSTGGNTNINLAVS